MNYNLASTGTPHKKTSMWTAFKSFFPLLKGETTLMIIAFAAIIINAVVNLAAPAVIGHAIDDYVVTKQYAGLITQSAIIFSFFAVGLVVSYVQTRVMGGVAQRLLFTLRNKIFHKLQELPVAFFNQNKAGDLISRINNDTDKLNQFFSQSLMQFIGNFFMIFGAGLFILFLHPKLGLAALAPAIFLFVFTRLVSPWVKGKNVASLQSVGGLSAEIQESLNNFKVIVAFNRRDYFRKKFSEASTANYDAALSAGIANNVFIPMYGLCSNIAQLIVLAYGVHLIVAGQFTVGLLISYLVYVTRFYDPLRQIAALWATFQTAAAAWDRISAILAMTSNIETVETKTVEGSKHLMEFRGVHFKYPDGKEVLHGIDFMLETGKTYALVGPTGGGKTTTASIMARLYDPTKGAVMINGKDIRSYTQEERTRMIGFILQEPFLFSGTLRENLLYGNDEISHLTSGGLHELLKEASLEGLLVRFDQGLDTNLTSGGDAVSLGQKQLIAFMRAVLRKPELLILDEATANIDTVTEQLLEEILAKLPKSTTKVIIAHRLNTIANADEIFFVNARSITRAGSMEHAVEMLLHNKRES